MPYTERFTEVNYPLATLAPSFVNTVVGTHNTAWLSMGDYHRAVVLLNVGEGINGDETIDLVVQEAQDNAGTGAQNITGKAITQIAAADADSIVAVELQGEELTPGYSYIRVVVTVGGTGGYLYGVYVFGTVPAHADVPTTPWQEIVV